MSTQIQRTLNEKEVSRDFAASELKVGFCVSLTDSAKSMEIVFVEKVIADEVTFVVKNVNKPFKIVLAGQGDVLRDEQGGIVQPWGKPNQEV